jgi:hypothetical protein
MAKMFDDGPSKEKLPEGMQVEVVAAIKTDTQLMKAKAEAFVVSTQETFNEANALSEECARRMKKIDFRFADLETKTKASKAAADAARSAFLATIRELKEPYDTLMKILDGKAYAWRAAENKRLAEGAEEKRKAEQKRLDDLKEKKVEALEKAGLPEAAEEARLAVELADVPVEKVETSKGSTPRQNWKATCFDLKALCLAIAHDEVPEEFVVFNQSFADGLAKAQKAAFKYPGVIAKDVGVVAHKV